MQRGRNREPRPFWLPASNYYVLAIGISLAFFFVSWGILHDSGDETPWITAGIGASIILMGAVFLREVILRRARRRFLMQQRMLADGYGRRRTSDEPTKLSLSQNAAILNQIKLKSDAANVLNKVSAGHREVFELCNEYIAINESELKGIGVGSPRLGALLKGRSAVAEFHRYHLLKWAETESRSLTNDAKTRESADERIAAANKALGVIESALESYPSESALLDSKTLLLDLIVSIKVTNIVEEAEKFAFKGDYTTAKGLYRDALFYLGRDNIQSGDRENAAQKIHMAIERIRVLESGGQ